MEVDVAMNVLGFEAGYNYTLNEVNKRYRTLALQHHPDKNSNSEQSSARFKEINEAYVLLKKTSENNNNNDGNNDDENNDDENNDDEFDEYEFIYAFVSSFSYFKEDMIITIRHFINGLYEKAIINFDSLDSETALKLYELITTYNFIFNINEEYLNRIKQRLEKNVKRVILHPTLEELYSENNIHVLDVGDDGKIYVPLWHTELQYNVNGETIIVNCLPKLPNYIHIDADNNIHMDVRTHVSNLMDVLNVPVCARVYIPTDKIRLKRFQKIRLKNKGIPKINITNIYNIKLKSDIIINLEILI